MPIVISLYNKVKGRYDQINIQCKHLSSKSNLIVGCCLLHRHLFDAQYAHDAQSANAHYALYIIYVPKSCCAMSGSSACHQWS